MCAKHSSFFEDRRSTPVNKVHSDFNHECFLETLTVGDLLVDTTVYDQPSFPHTFGDKKWSAFTGQNDRQSECSVEGAGEGRRAEEGSKKGVVDSLVTVCPAAHIDFPVAN